jgi:NADPH:quinone reductase-like Zn-dependent oxidoreductase
MYSADISRTNARSSFPYLIGFDVAGVIIAVGSGVKNLKPGDEVYSRVPDNYRGVVSEYALSTVGTTSLKPKSLSFNEAAAVPLAAGTALQCLERGDSKLEGGLKGKTVLIVGGLSGTGSFGVQLAKNVFGAATVITTLSTVKVAKAKELWGEEGITYVDYTKEDVVKKIGHGTVDFFFDTQGLAFTYLPVVKKGGVVVSISMMPSGDELKENMVPELGGLLRMALNGMAWWPHRKMKSAGVDYSYLFMHPGAEMLDRLSGWIDEGKVKPVVGRQAKLFDEFDEVKAGCQQILDAKGGTGKFVVQVV